MNVARSEFGGEGQRPRQPRAGSKKFALGEAGVLLSPAQPRFARRHLIPAKAPNSLVHLGGYRCFTHGAYLKHVSAQSALVCRNSKRASLVVSPKVRQDKDLTGRRHPGEGREGGCGLISTFPKGKKLTYV